MTEPTRRRRTPVSTRKEAGPLRKPGLFMIVGVRFLFVIA
jgi:hypothetical protein